MADVFISYAREDAAPAEQIARALQGMGLDVFWDSEIPPGQTWADYIEAKLTGCKAVIVLWSDHSIKSAWVREEARMGRERAKLIPVRLDDSVAPFGFGEVQAADLSTWRGEAHHTEWRRFAGAVYAAARDGAPAPHIPATQPTYAPPLRTAQPSDAGPSLSPLGYIQKCFRLFINGKGRARRAEYWWWIAFSVAVAIVAYMLDAAAFGFNAYTSLPNSQAFYGLTSLVLLAPTIAVTSRRFHDVGLSGWLVAAAFGAYFVGAMMMASYIEAGAVLVGAVALTLLVIAIIPSRPGENAYGPNPKTQQTPQLAV
jgi:uncharacterized membrane protein YhaH (DUF805 family)